MQLNNSRNLVRILDLTALPYCPFCLFRSGTRPVSPY